MAANDRPVAQWPAKNDRLVAGHTEMAQELCKALRIPIDSVRGFELRVFAGELATIKVSHYLREADAKSLVFALSTFNFELKPEAADELLSWRPWLVDSPEAVKPAVTEADPNAS